VFFLTHTKVAPLGGHGRFEGVFFHAFLAFLANVIEILNTSPWKFSSQGKLYHFSLGETFSCNKYISSSSLL
jgi:hypothetical protein